MRDRLPRGWLGWAAAVLLLVSCTSRTTDPGKPLRLGFFPNVTHAQALVGNAEGVFTRAMGKPIAVKQFNAGPAAMEALLAGEVDVSYVGSAPAIAAYARSGEIRVIAGSCSGGAFLIVHHARGAQDLVGQRVGTPQLGNSQDVALRSWLVQNGIKVVDSGKKGVIVTPMENSEILALFRRGELAGAWVPEPWASRLILEGGGHVLVDERDLWPNHQFPTTVLVATRSALEKRPEDVKAILRAHLQLTRDANADPEKFARRTNAALAEILGKPLKPKVLDSAFSRLRFTVTPMRQELALAAEHAKALDFIPNAEMSGLVDDALLKQVQSRFEQGVGGSAAPAR